MDISKTEPKKNQGQTYWQKNFSKSTGTASSSPRQLEKAEKIVKDIFFRFGAIYGDAWMSKFKNPAWKTAIEAEWKEVISNLEKADILAAMQYLKSPSNTTYITFPPNVLEFRELANRLSGKSVPSVYECFEAAIGSDWEFHPIIYPIVQACNAYWFRRASDEDARRRFSIHYTEIKEKFLCGELLSMLLTEKSGSTEMTSTTIEFDGHGNDGS